MKRIFTIVLALVVAVSMGSFAFAEEGTVPAKQLIGKAKAKSIALKNAKLSKGKVRAMEIEYDSEDKVYEVEFIKKKNRAEYNYDINAYTGKILKKSIDYKYKKTRSTKKIGKKKARKKAAKRARVSYSTVKKGTCRFDKKRRGSKYEIKFRKGNYKYEVEVLARNGKIIEYEYKYIGR